MGLAFPFVILSVSGFCSGLDVSGSKRNFMIIFSVQSSLKRDRPTKPKSVTGKEAPFPSLWLEQCSVSLDLNNPHYLCLEKIM